MDPPPCTPRPPPAPNRRIALGRAGEHQAEDWYVAHGYQILERNWRSRLGEIDLVCARAHDNLVVFCEVKTRRTDRLGEPAEAVTRTKQLRLRRLAADYLHHHVCGPVNVRFDVVAVLGTNLTVIESTF